jgi:hypothetical protein
MNTDTFAVALPGRLAGIPPRTMVRLALKLDAVVTGANGLAYLAAASLLDSPLGISAGVLRGVGAFLIVFAIGVWVAGSRPTISTAAVKAIVTANAIWAADSVIVAIAGWGSPTPGGTVWIVLQAIVVAGFAALQAWAVRRV